MATLYGTAAKGIAPTPYGAGETVTRTAKYVVTATTTAGDVVQMVKVPAGAQIVDINVYCPQDANLTAVEVGDGGDVDRFFASFDPHTAAVFKTQWVGGAAGGLNYVYSAEDTIDIKLTTGTLAADSVLRLQVTYKMNEQISDESSAF